MLSLQWEKFKFRKPKPGDRDPDDEAALAHAEETIGDYKLKNSADYKVPQHLRESKVKKYKQLLNTREKVCCAFLHLSALNGFYFQQFFLRHNYNIEVHEMRDRKKELREFLFNMHEKLESIHLEIPKELHKEGPPVPDISENLYMEANLEVVVGVPNPEEPDPNANKGSDIAFVKVRHNIVYLSVVIINFEILQL